MTNAEPQTAGRCHSAAVRTTFHALAEQTGVAVNTVKNIAHDLINELSQTVRSKPRYYGIDSEPRQRVSLCNLSGNT